MPSCSCSYIDPFRTNPKYSVQRLDCADIFPLSNYFCTCSGVGAGGGCVERRSPGPALSDHSASGREQEAASESLSQRVPRHRGRPAETGGWVVCSKDSQPGFDRYVLGGFKMIYGTRKHIYYYGILFVTAISYILSVRAGCQLSF